MGLAHIVPAPKIIMAVAICLVISMITIVCVKYVFADWGVWVAFGLMAVGLMACVPAYSAASELEEQSQMYGQGYNAVNNAMQQMPMMQQQ